jgi:hypothetical protein
MKINNLSDEFTKKFAPGEDSHFNSESRMVDDDTRALAGIASTLSQVDSNLGAVATDTREFTMHCLDRKNTMGSPEVGVHTDDAGEITDVTCASFASGRCNFGGGCSDVEGIKMLSPWDKLGL